MKIAIVLATVLAASSAQRFKPTPSSFSPFSPTASPYSPFSPTPAPFNYNSLPPPRPNPIPNRANGDQNANIIRYDNDVNPDGSFAYKFEIDNGINAEAQGTPRSLGGNPPVVPVVIQGSYAYTSPEGVPIAISYIADENGFQAQGDAIPTPPPIPEAILRALEYIRSQPPAPQK